MSQLDGNVVCCGQHTGPEIQLRIFGDEFYARYETLEGYTVVYDTDVGGYCYAALAAGHLVSTGVPADKLVPAGTRRHIKEAPEIRNEKFGQRYATLRPPERTSGGSATRTFGPDNGLLAGTQLTSGNIRGLTILVEFTDIRTTVTAADVEELLNGDDYTEHGNFCSVKEYFANVSSSKLQYTNLVVGPIRLSKRRSHYIGTLLVKEALDAAVEQFHLDLSDFDSTGTGVVDAINILYAGPSQYSGELWPHNSVRALTYDGIRTHFYLLTGLGSAPVDLRIGTICHENGHMLCRFPDMYDYGERDGDHEKSQGIGRYCLMGSGNHLDDGRTPSPVCAYLRDLVRWVDHVEVLAGPGMHTARHGAYNTTFKWETDAANEYFLIENRTKRGLDTHLPASGLAVYHCDTLGSNEWQNGTQLSHYQCALLQADGSLDLESNLNAGDADDLFASVAGIAVSNQTVPSTRQWDGRDSGLQLASITAPGETIEFRTGEPAGATHAVGHAFPNLIIPDDDPVGVTSTIDIAQAGALVGIEVRLHVFHSWVSDLQVSLESPGGKRIFLHRNEGADGDDIDATFASDAFTPLRDFEGDSIQGAWKLHVVDQASADVGRLREWGLDIEFDASAAVLEANAEPALAIPDLDPVGVSSSIAIAETGTVSGMTVMLDIDHTFIGDLEVDLVAPSGASARLHDNSGGAQHDLKRTYDSTSSTALASMVGQPTGGDWILRVRDLANADVGTLNRWGVTIRL
ncbi:MAG: M6 family metalloprotease domain-containing protein [bacterium]|nr:M6 family metalloprotease domain-containing protein [bacterium]